MGSFSDYTENKVLDHITGKATFSAPAGVWIALVTVDPVDSDTGSTITEPSGNNYARKSTSASDWTSASGGATSNAAAITFNTASGSWGTIHGFVLIDSSSGAGNVLAWGTLTVDKSIASGDTPSFAIGDLDITLD